MLAVDMERAGGASPRRTNQHHPQQQHQQQQHTLEWHIASFTVPARRGAAGAAGGKGGGPHQPKAAAGANGGGDSNNGMRTILKGLAGRAVSGELIAVMGPSGAGKTTLLECVALRNRGFEGSVHYDGEPCSGRWFTTSAFVHQHEMLHPYLTPRETLQFHATARMSGRRWPSSPIAATVDEERKEEAPTAYYTAQDIRARVEALLGEMKLAKCADTQVGGTDPLYTAKGLSGGERKRLAIATELLLAPSVIFLDEPSSGLDAVMSLSVFETLKDLTDGSGRIVLATVHCPSSKTYHLFSRLLLLTVDGRLAYQGPASEALEFLQGVLRWDCPANYNPGDFVLEAASATPGADPGEEAPRMDAIAAAYDASPMKIPAPLPVDNRHKTLGGVQGQAASHWTLFKLNLWRCSLQLSRDKATLGLWAAVSALIGVLLGILYWQQAAKNWRNLMGLLFSVVVANFFLGCMGVILRFSTEWGIVTREYFAGANAMGPYLLARFIGLLPLSYGPFILALLVYWMTGMKATLGAFLLFVATFVSFNWACFALGMWTASFSANPLTAMTILPAFTTPMLMFSGLLYQRSSVPTWLKWIEDVSLVNYAFDALLAQQESILPGQQPEFLRKFIEYDPKSMGKNIGLLWALAAGLQFLTYVNVVLRLRATKVVN